MTNSPLVCSMDFAELTISNTITPEYDNGNIKIADLKDILGIEIALFKAFKQQIPEKAEMFDTLLKMNNNDYELTICQILTAKKEKELLMQK